MTNPVNAFVVAVFGNPWAALIISALLMLACAFIIYYNGRKHYFPTKRALALRVQALGSVREAATMESAQEAFAQAFEQIDGAMTHDASGTSASEEIAYAWGQFRETILDETEVPMRATARADDYFLHLGDDTRVLAWWANLFVAFGLTFTFLGIVAALTKTVGTLQGAGGAGNMTPALIELLTITSVKFWTSIAGVVASIILRYFDRRWHAATLRQLECIVQAIDRGTLFSPPQRIAADHLRETREQTAALKSFSHELAVAIGDNLERQMQPMVQVLGGIQSSIDDFKSGSFNQIGKELSEAISRNAGTEMQQLGTALSEMTTRLSTMHEQIEGSGKVAHDQMTAAGRDFATATERMTSMFASLNEQVEATGTKLTETANETSRGAAEKFTSATSGLQEAFDQVRGEISELASRLSDGANAAADRNAEVLARAAEVLESATTRASETAGQVINDAIERAGEESARVMSESFASFTTRFNDASAGLVETLRSTSGRMEALAASIERAAQASDSHADKLSEVGARTVDASAVLSRAANDIQIAANPIKASTAAIEGAITRVQSALEQQSDAARQNQSAIADIAANLSSTSEAAESAWRDYRARFEQVDQALGQALEQIKNASIEHAGNLNQQVGRMDNVLASAIDKLAGGLEPLSELADQIEDLLGKLQARA